MLALLPFAGAAQIPIATEVMRATVMLNGVQTGAGVIFATSGKDVWIATAGHITGDVAPAKVTVQLARDVAPSKCDVVASTTQHGQERVPDLAVVRCDCGSYCDGMPANFDLLAASSPRRGQAATLIGNISVPWYSPAFPLQIVGTIPTDPKGMPDIESANTSGVAIQGASGGPFLNEQSEMLGLTIRTAQRGPIMVYAAGNVAAWIDGLDRSLNIPKVQWRRRSPSAPGIYPRRTEFALSSSSVRVPQLAWFAPAPSVRIARNLPGTRTFLLAADMLFTGTLDDTAAGETLRIAFPSIALQWQGGSWFPWLRRNTLLGGLYGGVGLGFAAIDNRVNTQELRVRSWAAVYEAGLRIRMRGPWGTQFSYRAANLFERSNVNRYPRFGSIGAGVFLLLQ